LTVGQRRKGAEGREWVKIVTGEQKEGRVTEEQDEGSKWVTRE
jgi:hypothetical protein